MPSSRFRTALTLSLTGQLNSIFTFVVGKRIAREPPNHGGQVGTPPAPDACGWPERTRRCRMSGLHWD
jgi:hypothetical protein